MTIEAIYQSQITTLPIIERLRLARLIMDDLAESAPDWVVESSDAWTPQDLYDIGRASRQQADALNEAIDALLCASDDEAARTQIEPASRAQVKADELNERYQAAVRVTARLRDQVRSLQTQVDEARQQQEHLGLRESGAESLEKLHQLQREQRKDARTLNEDLTTRRETVARREDRLAARDEIKHDE